MEYSKFLEIVTRLKNHGEASNSAMKLKIDLLDFCDDLHHIISILIKEVYGEEGYDWFSWFCYESDYGEKDWSLSPLYQLNKKGQFIKAKKITENRTGARDKKGNPICYSIESTWDFLEKNYSNRGKGKL